MKKSKKFKQLTSYEKYGEFLAIDPYLDQIIKQIVRFGFKDLARRLRVIRRLYQERVSEFADIHQINLYEFTDWILSQYPPRPVEETSNVSEEH